MNRFVIVAENHSGSELLCSYLKSNPKIFCFGEIFGRSIAIRRKGLMNQMDLLPATETQDPAEYLLALTDYVAQRRYEAFGFALSCPIDNIDLINCLIENRFKIIHLKRFNLLNRFLADNKQRTVTPFEILENMNESYSVQEQVEQWFWQLEMIEVVYEDLVEKPKAICFDLQKFIGVVPKFDVFAKFAEPKMQPQSFLLQNYDEIYKYFLNELPECIPFLEDIPLG